MSTQASLTFALSKTLFLHGALLNQKSQQPAVTAPQGVNRIAVIDCSGSMAGQLGRIRQQLKERMPHVLGPEDTLSLIWFSGRGEFGTLLEAAPVATLKDLQAVNNVIDRWLRDVGWTGFVEPLQEVVSLVDRIRAKNPNPFSLIFMSDGCDNQWGRGEILAAMTKVAAQINQTTVVEYGYYADRPMLTKMAEIAGGQHLFAKDFDAYAPQFEGVLKAPSPGGRPVVPVQVQGALEDLAFVVDGPNKAVLTYQASKANVTCYGPTTVWWLSTSAKGGDHVPVHKDPDVTAALYAAVALYARRMQSDTVLGLLKVLEDVSLIKEFGGCFGKQRYSAFCDRATKMALEPKARLPEGRDAKLIPPEDAYTVLDLLQQLQGSNLLLDHKDFTYHRIGRASEDAQEALSKHEREQIETLTKQMQGEKNAAKVASLAAQIADISAKAPKLVFDASPIPEGVPASDLVLNETRPNVSLRVRRDGIVDLTAHKPPKGVPAKFPTNTYRNYTIVRDGILNVGHLPVSITEAQATVLALSVPSSVLPASWTKTPSGRFEGTLDLTALPIINRKMVKAVSAKTLLELEWALTKKQAEQKVYNAKLKELSGGGKATKKLASTYGDEAAAWLGDRGLADYGFNPKTTQAPAQDFYMARELKVAIKGYSALPDIDKALAAEKDKKVNGPAQLVLNALKAYDKEVAALPNGANRQTWLEGRCKEIVQDTRGLLFQKAQQVFSIIVGQVWPKEFKSLDETTLEFEADGLKLTGSITPKETKIDI